MLSLSEVGYACGIGLDASALAFPALLDAPTLCHKRAQLPCHEPHHCAPHGLRPCANVRRVGAPTRGRRSLRLNQLEDAAKEQLPGGEAAAVQRAARQARVPRRHYEAWLDYVYYSSGGLRLVAYQEPLTEEQAQLVYKDGDALPNAWHPSDHLPVGCVFEWQ